MRGKVKSLHDGEYMETEIRHGGGRYFSMGLTAVIEVEGSTRDDKNLLVLTTRRVSPNQHSPDRQLRIYPERQKILVAKGTIAPRAAYEPVPRRSFWSIRQARPPSIRHGSSSRTFARSFGEWNDTTRFVLPGHRRAGLACFRR